MPDIQSIRPRTGHKPVLLTPAGRQISANNETAVPGRIEPFNRKFVIFHVVRQTGFSMKTRKICRYFNRYFFLASIGCVSPAHSQWTSGLLLEGLGPGGFASMNYTLGRTVYPVHIQLSAGAGMLRLTDFENRINPDLSFPLGLEASYGGKHQALIGGGMVLTGIVRFSENRKIRQWKTPYYLAAGYKRALKSGWYIKVAYTPLIDNGYFRHWGTVGLGYAF